MVAIAVNLLKKMEEKLGPCGDEERTVIIEEIAKALVQTNDNALATYSMWLHQCGLHEAAEQGFKELKME